MLSIVRECSVRVILLCLICASPVWVASVSADEPAKHDSAKSDPAKSDPAAHTEEVVQTEEIVVSATKTPVPVSQVTSAVEVITDQDMKKQNIRTVADALRLAQGVAAFQSGGPGTEINARIRGGSSSQTLVLIDGAIVNSGTLGSYDFANLTTDNIERVEILRGAQSMLWGSHKPRHHAE